jgi:hypothetical protein
MVVLALENGRKEWSDIDTIIKKSEWKHSFMSGLYSLSGNRYKYTNDSLELRLHYYFHIPKQVSTVKLNSFTFTQKEDKDTIPYILYCKGLNIDSGKNINGWYISDIDSLPFYMNEKEKQQFRGVVSIIIECSEAYININKIYISYDIELDNERIVKKNIRYKRYLRFDCRPKF